MCALPAVSVGLCPKGHWRETAKLGDREGMVPSVSGISWRLFHFPLSRIGEGNGNPLQCSCLENPMDREAW